MRYAGDSPGPAVRYSRRPVATWPGLFVAALAFGIDLGISYPLVTWSCNHQQHAIMHVVHAIFLAIALWGTWHGWRVWQVRRDAAGSDAGDRASQEHFLGMIGASMSAIFALGIASQWFTAFVLSPCFS